MMIACHLTHRRWLTVVILLGGIFGSATSEGCEKVDYDITGEESIQHLKKFIELKEGRIISVGTVINKQDTSTTVLPTTDRTTTEGYATTSDYTSPYDCNAGSHNCDANAECRADGGSFTCSCISGYTGNGTSCADEDECDNGTDTCDKNATCHNTPGSFHCTCDTGYTGNGTACFDISECDTELHDCDANAICHNTDGSYKCTCKFGFTGNGRNCTSCNNSVFKFPNEEHKYYVLYQGTLPDMTSSTVCFWIRSVDEIKPAKGSILSYCTSDAPACNTITAFLKGTKIQGNINGKTLYFDMTRRIIYRTYICLVMSKNAARIYINGTEIENIYAISAAVADYGVLIFGQNQDGNINGDIPGEPVDPQQGFYGRIGGIHIWDRVLNSTQINRATNSIRCGPVDDAFVIINQSNACVKGKVTTDFIETCLNV